MLDCRNEQPTPPVDATLLHDIDTHLPLLRARALKLCRNAAEAEDLVQDTIVRALRFESTFEKGTNLRAWLHQILLSVFVTRCRRSTRERRALEWLTVDPCAWTHSDPPPAIRFLSRRVEAALDELPEKFADVIRLVDLGDLSYRDAAEGLGVPVGTVMSRLFRGRRLLATALTETPLREAA
jgi:RNA polymerase sigma-70 factor (ECF subfamily)